jgi:cell division protein FtsZ
LIVTDPPYGNIVDEEWDKANVDVDFADVDTVMAGSEVFIMGTGVAEGENRAMTAVYQALESPLLDSNDIYGTKDILLNIISGEDEITMGEIGDIIEYLQEKAGQDANIIWGNGIDRKLGNQISVTIIATRFNKNPNSLLQPKPQVEEFVLENDREPNININEDTPKPFAGQLFETVNIEQQTSGKMTTSKGSTRGKKKPKELISEQKQTSGNTDSWFLRQFNRFFEDQDEKINDNE